MPDLTGPELKAIRKKLGQSCEAFARTVRVASGRTVRRWEAGESDIPGPVQVLAPLLLVMHEASQAGKIKPK